MNRLRAAAALATLAIVLIACTSAASSNAGEPSTDAAAAASEELAPDGGILPSLTEGAVADLEAWIPDAVAGVAMKKVSMRGNESLLEFDADVIGTLLQDLGVSENEVSLAIGVGYSATVNFSARMFVFRAAGVDSDRLAVAFKKATDSSRDTPLDWTATTIDGKQVETAADGPATNYLYVDGDVLVFLVPSDQEIAAEIISGLP
ncbi:MAG: hypothetical protein WD402_05355 [Chloroflexota bacterium]